MNNEYCSMIHGGLMLDLKTLEPRAQHCCLRDNLHPVDIGSNFWNDRSFATLRQQNAQGVWDPGCANCQVLEQSQMRSMRQGMNDGLEIYQQTDIKGPARIDLMFDISCNLACRTCGVTHSTFWQKHLSSHGLWNQPVVSPKRKTDVIQALSNLDLSNLQQVVFCGGETLLGQEYWQVADWLVSNVPNAQNQLTLAFQTNGTQPIDEKYFSIIGRAHLVKLHISLDGVGKRFEYLRWPASWSQVVDNIMMLRTVAPSNVMFLIEETISIFNLYYISELEAWIQQNFTQNREGDVVNHTRHMANGIFDVANCSRAYMDYIAKTTSKNLLPETWKENPEAIKLMLGEIEKFDQLRDQKFSSTFTELADLYNKFL